MAKEREGPAYVNDRGFYWIVVGFLGGALLASSLFIGCAALQCPDSSPNTALVAIASGSLGALAGLFK